MDFILGVFNSIFALAFSPLEGMRPERALLVVSVVASAVMFLLYRKTSDQAGLKRVQDRIKAHVLEITLYKTDIRVMFRALGRVFLKNLTYMRLLLLPAVFLLVVVGLLIVQMYPRFQCRPFRLGERFVVTAAMKSGHVGQAAIVVPKGLTVEAGPVSAASLRGAAWRLRADRPGNYSVDIVSGGEKVARPVVVSDGIVGVSMSAGRHGLSEYLHDPLGASLPDGSAFASVTVDYPERHMRSASLLGMDWMVYFFVVSFVAALALKFIFKAS